MHLDVSANRRADLRRNFQARYSGLQPRWPSSRCFRLAIAESCSFISFRHLSLYFMHCTGCLPLSLTHLNPCTLEAISRHALLADRSPTFLTSSRCIHMLVIHLHMSIYVTPDYIDRTEKSLSHMGSCTIHAGLGKTCARDCHG